MRLDFQTLWGNHSGLRQEAAWPNGNHQTVFLQLFGERMEGTSLQVPSCPHPSFPAPEEEVQREEGIFQPGLRPHSCGLAEEGLMGCPCLQDGQPQLVLSRLGSL